MDPFDTTELQRVKSRISAEAWQLRVAKAKEAEAVLQEILAIVAEGAPLNAAIAKVVPPSRRSWVMRHLPKYREQGVSALVDHRMPREPKVTLACRHALQAARAANPKLSVEAALEILRDQKITPLPSGTTIKREFARVDARRRYAAGKERREREKPEVTDLPFAGGELLLAAEQETGGVAALTAAVTRVAEAAQEAAADEVPEKDLAHRDRKGRFTVTYNRQRRRRRGEPIASYLRPAAEKALDRVPTWPRFVRERPTTIEAKLRMLSFGWLVASSKGWNALRAPDVAGLVGLTGFAYMPSTLSKFVSALAISGAGRPLLETVGQHWHSVAEAHFEEPGAMAALYVDNHAKEVWSSLYTKSGKVSHRSRVMPCITTTYVHTGAGTPVVLSVQSGSAPLAPRLVDLVEQTEALLEGDIERAVVIDAEGSTFDLLESFSQRDRVLVTPLRPARAPELELHFSRGSYYRPYREHDELRVARCTLTRKSTGHSLDLGALLVRREHRESETVLLTTGLDQGLSGRELADLYFRRWPVQENAFKEGAAALQLDKHRGNCGRMVANVAVVTQLERIAGRIERIRDSLRELREEQEDMKAEAKRTAREDRKAQSALTTRRRRLDARVDRGRTNGTAFAKVALEHQEALVRAETTAHTAEKANAAYTRAEERIEKFTEELNELLGRQKHLEPQRSIRQLDVAQDEVLTATKLTASQLISFVLREYLPQHPMTPETFANRIFTIHGRKEVGRKRERVLFYKNPRDPEMTVAMRDACKRLNRRQLTRGGRTLRYELVDAPDAEGGRFD